MRISRPSALLAVVACALAVPAVAHADHGGDAVSVEGDLQVTHSDDFSEQRSKIYYTLRQGARRIKLDFAGRGVAFRGGARLRVRGTLSGNRLRVADARRVARPAGRRSLAALTAGPRRVAVLLFNFSNDTSQPFSPAQAAGVVFSNPGSVNAYFQEASFGTTSLTGDVFGWYTIAAPNTSCAVETWAQAAAAAAASSGVSLAGYQHVVYAFPRAASCGWAGLAEMPGSRSWINGAFNLRVVGHELSHNFGVHHAAALSCTENGQRVAISASCTKNEYGDPFDLMGAAASRHTSSWHKGQFGWLASGNMQTASASGTYTISPHQFSAGGVQALRVPRGATGNYYYLEFRQPFGAYFDNFSPGDPAVNGVSIRLAPDYASRQLSHLIDTTPATSSFADAPLGVGQTFSDGTYSLSIRTKSVSPVGATVEISIGGAPPPPPPPPPPPSGDTTPPSTPGTLSAQVLTGSQVALGWGASTDNVGVAGYRLYRNGTLLASTSSTSYTDVSAPAGATLVYDVRAYDAAGNVGPARSITVTTPGPSTGAEPPRPLTAPTISGRARVGELLTATTGTWSGTAPMTFAYRWARCRSGRCVILSSAKAKSYRLSSADVGSTMRVIVTARNARGSTSVLSAATAVVKVASTARSRGRTKSTPKSTPSRGSAQRR